MSKKKWLCHYSEDVKWRVGVVVEAETYGEAKRMVQEGRFSACDEKERWMEKCSPPKRIRARIWGGL